MDTRDTSRPGSALRPQQATTKYYLSVMMGFGITVVCSCGSEGDESCILLSELARACVPVLHAHHPKRHAAASDLAFNLEDILVSEILAARERFSVASYRREFSVLVYDGLHCSAKVLAVAQKHQVAVVQSLPDSLTWYPVIPSPAAVEAARVKREKGEQRERQRLQKRGNQDSGHDIHSHQNETSQPTPTPQSLSAQSEDTKSTAASSGESRADPVTTTGLVDSVVNYVLSFAPEKAFKQTNVQFVPVMHPTQSTRESAPPSGEICLWHRCTHAFLEDLAGGSVAKSSKKKRGQAAVEEEEKKEISGDIPAAAGVGKPLTHVVSLLGLKEHPEKEKQIAKQVGLHHVHIELDGASDALLRSNVIVTRMHEALWDLFQLSRTSGNRVLVHCAAGLHRTGTVGYSLLRLGGRTPLQARMALCVTRKVTADGVAAKRLAVAEELWLPPLLERLNATADVVDLTHDDETGGA